MKKVLNILSQKKYCVPLVLGIFMLLIILPPIIHGYAYPNNSDDTAYHLAYFDSIQKGQPGQALYFGRWVVGYSLVGISNLTHLSIDTVFMWFNFAVLCFVGLSMYSAVALVFNWQAGLVAVPLSVFAMPSTLNLFDNGAVFDLITVGILFPLFLMCLVYAIKKRIPWLWLAVLLFPLLVGFHSIGLVGTMSVNRFAVVGITPSVTQHSAVASSIFIIMSRLVALVGCLVVVFLAYDYKNIKLDISQKLMVVMLFAAVIILGILSYTKLSNLSMRIAVDMTIVFTLLVACMIGILWQTRAKVGIMGLVVVVFFVLFSSYPVAKSYYGYNSALKPIDMEAIRYVNSIDGSTYSVSGEIAPWIYGRYLNKSYSKDSSIYIYRSQPMTYMTTTGSPYFWGNKWNDALSGHIVKQFWDDSGLTIVIWEE